MTQGTSTHGDSLSGHWTDAGHNRADGAWRRWMPGLDWRVEWARASEGRARLQLLALSATAGLVLGLLINASWWPVPDGGLGGAALYLAVLIASCVIAAIVALRPGGQIGPPPARQDQDADVGPSRLLAQMHHELRTPLNAMIGFSEVMLRELHGPLGNARYHEYAAHISESGGRLLKASEDALAVAATMTALMADRRALRRERLPARALLQQAWTVSEAPDNDIRLRMDDGGGAEIECDRQATSEALQHLLAEAVARTPPGGAIAASDGQRRIEIRVVPAAPTRDPAGGRADAHDRPTDYAAVGDGLRLTLSRSLIEMQGATLSVCAGPEVEGWTAVIAFPPAAGGQKPCSTAGARQPASLARRAGFAAVAAIRASAGSHSAPPA